MINIGKEIQRVMNERNETMNGLASSIGSYPSSISRLLDRDDVKSQMLLRISRALRFNFFKLIAQELEKEIPSNEPPPPPNPAEKEVIELRRENADLKEKISYLKTIQELVSKKK